MIKLVKNKGQVKALIGKSRYLLCANDRRFGEMYALPGLKPIFGFILTQIRFSGYTKETKHD